MLRKRNDNGGIRGTATTKWERQMEDSNMPLHLDPFAFREWRFVPPYRKAARELGQNISTPSNV